MKKSGEKIFWGVFFILGAVFLLVSRMGYLENISAWKLLLTVLLAAGLIKSARHFEFGGILFSLAFLAILYDKQLGIEALTPWTVLGAALLGTIGFEILFHNRRKKKYRQIIHDSCETVEIDEEDCVSYSTTFGSSIKYVNTNDLKQMKLECNFGDMKVYFDQAVIPSGSAVVHVKVAFGGLELFIPREWQVVNNTSAGFGGVNEKNQPKTTGTPVLTLTGSVGFGGIEITYV